ncbi:MAG: hypothetical protein E6921_21800 [Klebsiella michiganensis]|nr:hypothetical protein [Klebsiella michiganensis]
MGNQHLPDGGFIAHQLYQLIDSVLLQQIFRPLLLQRETGIEKSEPGTLAASGLRLPGQPAARLHHVE